MAKRRKAVGTPQVSKSRKTAKRLAKKAETLAAVVAKRQPNKNHKIKAHTEVEVARVTAKKSVEKAK